MPKHSDMRMVDILRNKYLGLLHNAGIKLLFYLPHNLHAKLLMIDDEIFSISSANFDFRSFRYQYEIALIGSEPKFCDSCRNILPKPSGIHRNWTTWNGNAGH